MTSPRIETDENGDLVLVCDVPKAIAHWKEHWLRMFEHAHRQGYVLRSWSTVSRPYLKPNTIEFIARLVPMGAA
jgi:hypothetical protein